MTPVGSDTVLLHYEAVFLHLVTSETKTISKVVSMRCVSFLLNQQNVFGCCSIVISYGRKR